MSQVRVHLKIQDGAAPRAESRAQRVDTLPNYRGLRTGPDPLVSRQSFRSETQPKFVPAEELSVPAWVYPYRVGVIGGALGGLVMVGVALVYGWLHGSIWLPVNLIGATFVGNLQSASLEQLSQFNLLALLAGLLLHFVLAIGLGFVFALLLPTLPGPILVWSVAIGSGLWIVASLLTLPLLNPVMNVYVDRPSFFAAHVVYGFVLGWWIRRTPKIHVR